MIKYIKFIFLSFCVLFLLDTKAQSIGLGVAFPEDDARMDQSISKVLVNKIHAILNKTDITDDDGDFVIVPKTSIISEDLIEGGMKNIYKVEIELTLEVLQLSTNKTFGTTAIELKGSGVRNRSAAVKDAVNNIRSNDNVLDNFFRATKQKIINYYEQNTASILSSANTAANNGDYEKAIAILSAYPSGIKGSTEAENKLTEVYNKYRNHNCKQLILQAKSAISVKNYTGARSLLESIDTDSSCSSEAASLIASINREVRTAESQARADRQQEAKLRADITKTRINAAKEVAKAYYQRTYPNYTIVFR